MSLQLNKTQYYRWQFLRYNNSYRLAYDQFQKALGIRHNYPQQREFLTIEVAKEFREDFGINVILDYNQTKIPEGLEILGEDPPIQKGTLGSIFEDRLLENQRISGSFLIERRSDFSIKGDNEGGDLLIQKYVSLVMNCDFAFEEIVKELQKIYNRTRPVRQRVLNQPRISTLTKSKVKELDECLKVYKLRSDNKKWTVIAKKMFPAQGLDSTEDRVRKIYDKAVKFIEGEYRKIVI